MQPFKYSVEGRGAGKSLLILMHGVGSNDTDMLLMSREIRFPGIVAALRAPDPHTYGGYSWFDIQWDERGIRFDPQSAVLRCQEIAEFIPHLVSDLQCDPRRVILAGFSQGGAMALHTGFYSPETFAGIVCMGGFASPETFPPILPSTPEVLMQHGNADDVVPIEWAQDTANRLTARGAQIDFRTYPMRHEVSWDSLFDLDNWLNDLIGNAR